MALILIDWSTEDLGLLLLSLCMECSSGDIGAIENPNHPPPYKYLERHCASRHVMDARVISTLLSFFLSTSWIDADILAWQIFRGIAVINLMWGVTVVTWVVFLDASSWDIKTSWLPLNKPLGLLTVFYFFWKKNCTIFYINLFWYPIKPLSHTIVILTRIEESNYPWFYQLFFILNWFHFNTWLFTTNSVRN